jgi:hypothetical protein
VMKKLNKGRKFLKSFKNGKEKDKKEKKNL